MTVRISDSYLSQLLVGDLNRSLGVLLARQRQASSMRRLQSFADDPRGVAAIQRFNSLLSTNDQYQRNTARAHAFVDATDTALQDISEVLIEARELVLRESSALANHETHQIAVVEVENLVARLLTVLNTNVEGNYIFSGHMTDTPPFVLNGDTVVYQGDEGEIHSQTGPNATMVVNIPGSSFLGAHSSSLDGTVDLAPRLTPGTALNDLSLGAGWQSGSIEIIDGTGTAWEVDLSAAVTIGHVMTAIGTVTGGAVTVGISSDGSALELTGAGPLSVGEVGGGSTAAALGINASSQAGVLTGRDIRIAVTATTNLTDIEALAGSLPLGSVDLEVDGNTYNIDFSAATTIGDLQATFDAAVPGHELQITSTGLTIVGGSPTIFMVTNGDATNSATALGIHGTGTPVRLFGLLEDLKAALAADDVQQIRGALTELAAVESIIHGEIIRTGGRQKDLDWIDGILRQRDERLRANLSRERDADMAQVSTDLSQAEASYQASLLVTSQLFEANLMMYLR